MANENNQKNKCLQCGFELNDTVKFCPECGFDLSSKLVCPICQTPFKINQKRCKKCLTPLPKIHKKLPKELEKFNIPAFFFTFFWSCAHKCYWPLIILIPFLGLIFLPIIAIYLGFKGNQIAWENFDDTDIEEFKKQESKWNICVWIVGVIIVLFALIMSLSVFIPNIKKMNKIVEIYNKQEFETICKPLANEQQCLENYKNLYSTVGEISKLKVKSIRTENKKDYPMTNICATAKYSKQNKDCILCVDIAEVAKDNFLIVNFDVKYFK